jgi:hypothetical protein
MIDTTTYFPNGNGSAQNVSAPLCGDAPVAESPEGVAEPCAPQSHAAPLPQPSALTVAVSTTKPAESAVFALPHPSRRRLIELNGAIADAESQLTELRSPLSRYHDVIRAEETAKAEHERRAVAHSVEIEQWISNACGGDRPEPPCTLIAAERAYAAASIDAAAARRLIVATDHNVVALRHRLDGLRAEREQMVREALVAAVEKHLVDVLALAIDEKNRAEHVVWNLHDALVGRGELTLAQTIAEMVHRGKSGVAAPEPDPSRGAQFLAALMADPAGATL